MSELALVVAVALLSMLVLLVGFALGGTLYALVSFRRRPEEAIQPRDRAAPMSGPGVGVSRRRFLVRASGTAAAAGGALLSAGVLSGRPAFAAGQGQCTSCVYGVGDSCDNPYSQVIPGCGGQCPPKQGYRVCSQRCFSC